MSRSRRSASTTATSARRRRSARCAAPPCSRCRSFLRRRPSEEGPERLLEDPAQVLRLQGGVPQAALLLRLDVRRRARDFNYAKRTQRAPLDGKVALITGARVKIGYQASLMLLRSGARVIATTRFPKDAARALRARARLRGRGRTGCTSTAWTCGTPPASSSSRGTSSRRTTGWTSSSTTRRRRCAGRPASTRTCWRASCAASTSCPPEAAPAARRTRGVCRGGAARRSARAAPDASTLVPTWRSSDPALGIHSSAALSLLPYALEQEGDTQRPLPPGPAGRGPAAGGPAGDELLADEARGRADGRDAGGPPGERGGAVHPLREAQAADAARPLHARPHRERLRDGGQLLARDEDGQASRTPTWPRPR